MIWLLLSIVATMFWALTNHIDKYLLSRYIKGGGIGSLIIFSCLFAVIVLPIILYIEPQVIDVEFLSVPLLIFVGVLNTIGVLFYLYALSEEEASIVVPLFQLTPIAGFLFAYLLLGEKISINQLWAIILIIIGAVILSLDIKSDKVKFRLKTIFYMVLATLSYGLHGTLFKMVAIKDDFLTAFFWEYLGLLLTGLIFLFFVRSYRDEFIKLIKYNTKTIISLNFLNETLVLVANILVAISLTLAPVSLVLAIGGYQPLFVFIIGIILTIFFPKISIEEIGYKYLIYKLLAIILVIYGGYLINL